MTLEGPFMFILWNFHKICAVKKELFLEVNDLFRDVSGVIQNMFVSFPGFLYCYLLCNDRRILTFASEACILYAGQICMPYIDDS